MKAKMILAVGLLCLFVWQTIGAQTVYPKREFRGAWIQCVNGQFQGMPPQQMQAMLIGQLDKLKEAGINAIIFQVRAECDALYKSSYEPWSRFLTGAQGQAPNPMWDPLHFMIDECHKRSMVLHAWLNPYRSQTNASTALPPLHPSATYPHLFLPSAIQFSFDPVHT